jgi:aminoglycoside phosphotransferase (APT) family kinase protein
MDTGDTGTEKKRDEEADVGIDTTKKDTHPRIDLPLVGRLIATQFPQWAGLPLRPVAAPGSDNVMYRLGETMVVRLPRTDWAAGHAEKEQRWLPALIPRLPLAVPVPRGMGAPAEGYPWHWSVFEWLDGESVAVSPLADPGRDAVRLAGFMAALQRIDPADGPPPGDSLADRDEATRAAIAELSGEFDADGLSAVWDAALRAPGWAGPPVWVHGDLHPGNLLAVDGRLSAVIDFGGLEVGDPARDLMIAWTLLTAETRAVLRAELPIDEATWTRGRGWALTGGALAFTAYAATNPVIAANVRRQLTEVLTDDGRG